ncbi:MAG: hypothetical protein K2X62_04000 [Beijerinckiaceae bacterium]|jgi:hypothetical protein|nr:hypothetical protein [Beijerinckiaceae bacterium]
MIRIFATTLALGLFSATPLMAQTPAGTPPKPASPASSQTSAPSGDVNANAPKGPALAEEPHGSGSVHEELKAEKANPKK